MIAAKFAEDAVAVSLSRISNVWESLRLASAAVGYSLRLPVRFRHSTRAVIAQKPCVPESEDQLNGTRPPSLSDLLERGRESQRAFRPRLTCRPSRRPLRPPGLFEGRALRPSGRRAFSCLRRRYPGGLGVFAPKATHQRCGIGEAHRRWQEAALVRPRRAESHAGR